MIGQYTVQRKVADLPEGYEFQENRFIADKNDRGCYVQYRSQEGDMRYIMVGFKGEFASTKSWMDANAVVDCIIDFVPDSHRELWKEMQKLGKCFLDYHSMADSWSVVFPENPWLNFPPDWRTRTQAAAIDDFFFNIDELRVVYNGHRYFDCGDHFNFKKISDDEAKKLMNETV